ARSPRRPPGRRRTRRRAGCARRTACRRTARPRRRTPAAPWWRGSPTAAARADLLTGQRPVPGPRAGSAPGPGEGDDADGGGDEHGDLAQRVEAADVDQDHVDHVAAVALGP